MIATYIRLKNIDLEKQPKTLPIIRFMLPNLRMVHVCRRIALSEFTKT